MKTAIVISDSHGNRAGIEKLFPLFSECDYIIHLGDTSADGAYIQKHFPEKTVIINGNCDSAKLGADEQIIEIENAKFFACHGHLYGVKHTLLRLAERAKEADCKYALYGHTHCAQEDEIEGVTLLNPGCMARYRENGYLYLAVNGEKAVFKLVRNI